jgi:hypothetical protein
MIARRLTLATLASLCAMALALAAGASPAAAEGTFQFGPLGEVAGQINFSPTGMAVDKASGDIYVSDTNNERVDKFDQSGKFLLAWGWGVATGAEELQTCTTSCQRGREEAGGAGAICLPNGVTVDNDPLSASYNDVYVVDFCGRRVEKFDSSGKFLLMFGGHVNKNGTNVCVAGEECQTGTEGTGDGEFSETFGKAYIAVGPGGKVYVGDKARVQILEPSGAWKENISLSALSSEGKVTALAVNSVGDVFVKDEGVPGVRGFEPGGIEMAAKFDEGSELVESIALDASGDLFISENKATFSEACKCDFVEYSPSGQQLASFGGHTLISLTSSMAFDEALGELLVYGTDKETLEYGHDGVWAFPVPPAGPLIEPRTETATPELRGAATLEATVNPEGNATEVKFEYVDEAHFLASGYASATGTSPESIGSSFNDQPVVIHLAPKALVPGLKYHWRIVGHNSQGTATGADQAFEEIPPAYIEGPWATNVSASSATLAAKIDPLGANTTYRLEYGTSTSYGHTFAGNVGEGMSFVLLSYHLQELQPNTSYHYRVLTSSEVGTVEGADHTFTTQLVGGTLTLPDGRAWELVSPPNKKGSLIQPFYRSLIQAAADGSGIAYRSSEAIGEGVVGKGWTSQILSTRASGGWRSQDISVPRSLTREGEQPEMAQLISEYWLFSSDLSQGVVEPKGVVPPLSPEVSERTIYLRDNATGAYLPLVTPANVPAGTKLGEAEGLAINYLAATPDLSHVVLRSLEPLTPEATHGDLCPHPLEPSSCEKAEIEPNNLYEWSAGRLRLVDILPDGKPLQVATTSASLEGSGALLGLESFTDASAMSSDGRWIVWMSISLDRTSQQLYVRDMVGGKTVQMGGRIPAFQTMSSDGSRVFFLEEGDLYAFDTTTGTQTDLTANHGAGERNAGVQNAVLGTSNDGSYVYFVAKGVLAAGAVANGDNLYVLHDSGGVWTTTYVSTLSSEDSPDWQGRPPSCVGPLAVCAVDQEYATSRVSSRAGMWRSCRTGR